MKHWYVAICVAVLSGLVASSALAPDRGAAQGDGAQPAPTPAIRSPLGVYAKLDVHAVVRTYTGSQEVHAYVRRLYDSLLANPAIAGITVGFHWSDLQVSDPACAADRSCASGPDGYDWSYLDAAFAAAAAANKSVQLLITPGMDSPHWLLARLASCDGLFSAAGAAPADCGTVTFTNFPEADHTDCWQLGPDCTLPLPWNPTYVRAWTDFLTHLAARYTANPAWVSVAMAGPISVSPEIIMPTTANGSLQGSSVPADVAWSTLIANAFPDNVAYQSSDQAFIDAWEQTIDTYEQVFAGLTLTIAADNSADLPEYSEQVPVHPDNTLYAQDCTEAPRRRTVMSCEAKTEILSYFVAASGPNGKATDVGGLTARSPLQLGDIGLAGVKLLTGLTPAPTPPLLGGAEFDHPVADQRIDYVGCPDGNRTCKDLPLTPEQAAYNVLATFFAGTPAGSVYGGAAGAAPVQYLQVPYVDVQYAAAHPCPRPPATIPGNMSLQNLLEAASGDLTAIASQQAPPPPRTCGS